MKIFKATVNWIFLIIALILSPVWIIPVLIYTLIGDECWKQKWLKGESDWFWERF